MRREIRWRQPKFASRFGNHEFEAEGTPEGVQEQFRAFRELLGEMENKSVRQDILNTPEVQAAIQDVAHIPLEKIMRVQGRVVSLTVMPSSVEEAAILVLLGNMDLRNNETATGQEIGDGLEQSGRPVPRVDRVMEKLISEAFVLKSGFRRSTRYRLSNSGHQKALAVARELVATLP